MASFPASTPACPESSWPLQIEKKYCTVGYVALMKAICGAMAGLRVPMPPGTKRTSIGGGESKVCVGGMVEPKEEL